MMAWLERKNTLPRRAAAMAIRHHRAFGMSVQRVGQVWVVRTGNGLYAGEWSINVEGLFWRAAGGRLTRCLEWMERAANPAPYRGANVAHSLDTRPDGRFLSGAGYGGEHL